MSETNDDSGDLQFETAAAGGIIDDDVTLETWRIPVIRAEIVHLRHDTDRLARALEGLFPARVGLHDTPQQINSQIDAVAAWLDDAEELSGSTG